MKNNLELVRKSREVRGFLIGENLYPAGFQAPRHSHDTSQFCMALGGACTETYRQNTWEYNYLSLEYFPAGEVHSLRCDSGVLSFSVEIPASRIEFLAEYSLSADAPVYSRGGALAQLLLKMHKEYLRMDEASPLAIEGLIFELLAEVSRTGLPKCDRTPPRWLDRVKDLLHEHFTDALTLAKISETVGIHPVHLSREFHKQFRCTIGEYVRRLRIEYACREISTTDLPLAKIALAAGFYDQSHFCRIFKQSLGVTPAEYRDCSAR
jgi:AraC family transcriptional regulator